jgi:hypothetical protein
MLRRKSRSPAENEAGGRKIKTSADDLKLPARAEKFRDFGGFPAMLLNFRLTIRISNDRAEMPATTPRNPKKSAVFSRTFQRRPEAEKILSTSDISSGSFRVTAEKRRSSLTN